MIQNTEVMTEISANQWNFITSENLTAKEAVEFLKNGMKVRTFRDKIRDICVQIYRKMKEK